MQLTSLAGGATRHRALGHDGRLSGFPAVEVSAWTLIGRTT